MHHDIHIAFRHNAWNNKNARNYETKENKQRISDKKLTINSTTTTKLPYIATTKPCYRKSRAGPYCIHVSSLILLFILALAATPVVSAVLPTSCDPCPDHCVCSLDDGLCTVNCAGQALSEVPQLSSLPEPSRIGKL